MNSSYAPSSESPASSLNAKWDGRARHRDYQFCGAVGFCIAFFLLCVIASIHGKSFMAMAFIALAAVAGLGASAIIHKILTGDERLVCYHQQFAALVASALLLRFLRYSVLSYLDIATLGTGLFLACGRIGCLLVGCCHGRPSRWGIRYAKSHAQCGFPSHYVSVRLFPIQAVESLLVFCLVAIGTAIVWKGAPPGAVLSFYIVAYALGRFFIEFARGDACRTYFAGFSEAQWTSLVLVIAVTVAERRAILSASNWHGLAAMGMGLCMVLITAWRRFDASRRFELLHPRHVEEIIGALDRLNLSPAAAGSRMHSNDRAKRIRVAETSLGYRISTGKIVMGSQCVEHYSLSRANGSLPPTAAGELSRLIGHLKHGSSPFRLVAGGWGVFHAFFDLTREDGREQCILPLEGVSVSGS